MTRLEKIEVPLSAAAIVGGSMLWKFAVAFAITVGTGGCIDPNFVYGPDDFKSSADGGVPSPDSVPSGCAAHQIRCGECVDHMVDPTHCGSCNNSCGTTEFCREGQCVPLDAHCIDGILNDDEIDVDCCGSCPACVDGKRCHSSADCQSGVCSGGTCVAPRCGDGIVNGSEQCDNGDGNNACAGSNPCAPNCTFPTMSITATRDATTNDPGTTSCKQSDCSMLSCALHVPLSSPLTCPAGQEPCGQEVVTCDVCKIVDETSGECGRQPIWAKNAKHEQVCFKR